MRRSSFVIVTSSPSSFPPTAKKKKKGKGDLSGYPHPPFPFFPFCSITMENDPTGKPQRIKEERSFSHRRKEAKLSRSLTHMKREIFREEKKE